MRQKGVLALRIVGIATLLLGILNMFSAVIYIVAGLKLVEVNLAPALFYAYTIVCFVFGFVELFAGISANRAYNRPEYSKTCFYAGLGLIGIEVLILFLLFLGGTFKVDNLTGLIYPIFYTLVVKVCR